MSLRPRYTIPRKYMYIYIYIFVWRCVYKTLFVCLCKRGGLFMFFYIFYFANVVISKRFPAAVAGLCLFMSFFFTNFLCSLKYRKHFLIIWILNKRNSLYRVILYFRMFKMRYLYFNFWKSNLINYTKIFVYFYTKKYQWKYYRIEKHN